MFRNVIFDLGNVLLFFDHAIFFTNISEKEKSFSPDELRDFVTSKKLDNKLSLGKISPQFAYETVKNKFHLRTGYREFCKIYGDIFTVNKPMQTYLQKLLSSRKHKVFLLSNTDAIHFNYIKKQFPFVMEIRNRVLSYEAGYLKPDIRIYEHLIRKYRINLTSTCFIDDIKEHIIAAEKTGITGIHYTSHDVFMKDIRSI